MAEGAKSMERGQHVSFERSFGYPRMLSSKSTWMIDWRSLELDASMACFGHADAQSGSPDLLAGVSS